MYKRWMEIFPKIINPLVAFFDSDEDLAYFRKLRAKSAGPSNLVLINRKDLWSFQLKDRIEAIYQQPTYPVHHPNTIKPEYPCIMHAKYELMQVSIDANFFNTKYFAWLDIGLFREITSNKTLLQNTPDFKLALPPVFEDTKVAYSDVFNGFKQIPSDTIFYGGFVWVSGSFFIAEKTVLRHWTSEYKQFVEYFISQKLMNSDQQVIFAAFSNYKPKTQIQTYHTDGRFNPYFHLGYLCKEMGKYR